uniref:hypoxia-inducible factor-proline dioxygenase n=1 Tax=Scylla olivacea TaxID=85551 RepID=A0A0N7ZAI3_SCYOL|nr:egl nine-like protein 1 [Scylla paramamosain]
MSALSGEHFGFVTDPAPVLCAAARRMSSGSRQKVCGQCGAVGDQLKKCSMCKMMWYCDEDHQRKHWSQHKPLCISKNTGGNTGDTSKNKNGQKHKKRSKKTKQETNFCFDKGVLEEVAGTQAAAALSHNEMQFQGNGGQGRGRRKSHMPDLSTPIDSSHPLEAQVPKTPPLYHVQESLDSLSLEGSGFSEEWFTNILQDVTKDLNKYGVCVVDDFLGEERADRILEEVRTLHSLGVMQAGQVVSQHVQDQARGKIRGDKITWVTGDEPHCSSIGQLVNVVDYIVAKANKHYDAGKLAQYNITWRTRAMVACYPGCDTHYVKHVDNPNGDGRCITAIYYLNKNWTPNDGGVLRIYPENCSDIIASINPCFDRMLFFWSDRRNPHEVMPAKIVRYAITVWYLDQKEREEYLARE